MEDRGTGSEAGHRIQGLEALLEAAKGLRLPPVENWNPPDCGDIGLRINSDGTWSYQGSPIARTSLVKLFSRILRRDADGRTYVVTPVEKVEVAVDDAPFLAVEMQVDGRGDQQHLTFRTNVDDIVRCNPSHPLRFAREDGSGGLKPHVLVRGRLEARVIRAVYYDLVELAVSNSGDGTKELGVWSGGAFFPLRASS
jgi:hypothetical protein